MLAGFNVTVIVEVSDSQSDSITGIKYLDLFRSDIRLPVCYSQYTSNNNKDMLWKKKWMPKNDTSEMLLVDQPGNEKFCRIRTLLDGVSKVKFT